MCNFFHFTVRNRTYLTTTSIENFVYDVVRERYFRFVDDFVYNIKDIPNIASKVFTNECALKLKIISLIKINVVMSGYARLKGFCTKHHMQSI